MGRMAIVTLDMARMAKERVRDVASHVAGFAGVGLTRVGDSYAVKVNLRDDNDIGVPKQMNGVPVVIEHIGPITKR